MRLASLPQAPPLPHQLRLQWLPPHSPKSIRQQNSQYRSVVRLIDKTRPYSPAVHSTILVNLRNVPRLKKLRSWVISQIKLSCSEETVAKQTGVQLPMPRRPIQIAMWANPEQAGQGGRLNPSRSIRSRHRCGDRTQQVLRERAGGTRTLLLTQPLPVLGETANRDRTSRNSAHLHAPPNNKERLSGYYYSIRGCALPRQDLHTRRPRS